MKKLALTWAALLAAAPSSHAIFGIGGHWAPAFGVEVEKNEGEIATSGGRTIRLDEKGATGLQGFGAKIWIDALPFIDVQASGNVQFATYDADVVFTDGTNTRVQPLKFDIGPMLPEGKPAFGRIYGDLAVLYPFMKLPPGISLVKIYGGGGLTFGMATKVMSADFAKGVLDAKIASGDFNPGTGTPEEVSTRAATILAEAIVDEGVETGMGGFVQAGAQLKPPIVPLAAYVDFKYHFLGFTPDLVSGGGLTMELGAALAF